MTVDTPTPTTDDRPPRTTAGWVTLVVVVVCVFALTGGGEFIATHLGHGKSRTHWTFASPGAALSIRSGAGDIQVVPAADGILDLKVTGASRPKLAVRRVAGGIDVSERCDPNPESCPATYTVRVPAAMALTLTSEGGDIDVTGVAGAVRAKSATGDVRLANLRGALDASASSGSITLTDIHGAVQARATVGDISGRAVDGPLVAETHTGTIDVRGAFGAGTSDGGGTVDVRNAAGAIRVRCTKPPRRVSATNGSGDIDLLVPSGDSYALDLSDNPATASVEIPTDPHSPRHITVDIGSGSLRLGHPDGG